MVTMTQNRTITVTMVTATFLLPGQKTIHKMNESEYLYIILLYLNKTFLDN
jgi:hypothetical protein